jgi:hypothetical protein
MNSVVGILESAFEVESDCRHVGIDVTEAELADPEIGRQSPGSSGVMKYHRKLELETEQLPFFSFVW